MADYEKPLLFGSTSRPSRWLHTARSHLRNIATIAFVHVKSLTVIFIFAFIALTFFPKNRASSPGSTTDGLHQEPYTPLAPANQSLHILIPATKADNNLCKLLFSASVLDYPVPVVMAWGQTIEESKQQGMWGGGTHLFKISKVLEWLQDIGPEHDDDLVVMMDGYDIWFQLRKELLIERYHQINAEANERIRKRMGRAARVEGIKQTIIFGSGKRCFPNEIHTIACWPLPPSPLPKDMWNGNSDTTIGSFPKQWSATRHKFLNSGFIMGPAKDMRALFTQAESKVHQLGQDPEPDDNGSRWSEKVYHSSDQSVFNMIFGEQEYQRELMRRHYISWFFNPILKTQELFGKDLSATADLLEGNPIVNTLNPPWSHASMEYLPEKAREFSIGLDYWSTITFQTANSESNGQWMQYNKPLEPQVKNTGRWECKPHLHPLPSDLTSAAPPFHGHQASTSDEPPADSKVIPADASWQDVPLYTQVCVGTVPVMVHLNGDKGARDRDWKEMWFQPHAQKLFESLQPTEGTPLLKGVAEKQSIQPGSVFADTGKVLAWEEICGGWDFQ